MEKEVILKSFGTGQITLPKKWRSQFRSPYFRARVSKQALVISPVDEDNILGVEETNEKIDEPGYTKIIEAKKLGYPNGIPAQIFLKALRESIEEDKKYGQNKKIPQKNRQTGKKKN